MRRPGRSIETELHARAFREGAKRQKAEQHLDQVVTRSRRRTVGHLVVHVMLAAGALVAYLAAAGILGGHA